ncbi:Bcrbg2 [Botrytis cinerea B05.10]|uniref:Bcrbg2 n=1 Tax=Botryotinia fuckeliana (strain B05.10) TaxID=332648 RepID=A0A384K6W8_BOTFB|nr:Bcrbg2 [Botrytis cinerea B05.10]ATZ58575.1 Bcrbg2 [Botrytis cinerea B05.10]
MVNITEKIKEIEDEMRRTQSKLDKPGGLAVHV